MSEGEIAYKHITVRKVAYLTVIQPWTLTFTEPLVFLLHTWVALIFGLLFIWLTSFPLVFEGVYGLTQAKPNCRSSVFLSERFSTFSHSSGTIVEIMSIIGTCFFAIGALIIANAVLIYLRDAFPSEIPSVMARSAFMRFSFGAAFPLFAPALYHNLGIHWESSLLGFLGLA
ncbi:uncharacterized protein Z519_02650 [Cladophialophora bantiana CBS 173.52]|uniref:Major facilitator superfamily (MFS) profile domain-containing protein n=1 Tax=Cladophialophora bantiana (strain ATCC 10958 / CBS 173.52 / CDC B-1940 / NIH 8579) TaxID=1442370 RepID=A0A0D2HV58_CLAB1|nr:uncharacterized protein Z519_02650 [Cladophialophora bantiana CBS 173.52]KIW97258.1 hypothetical protein Z519_02650 [Cladophialophora bantiana CBS 173.52]